MEQERDIEVGKIYTVHHRRKGRFVAKVVQAVEAVGDQWLGLEIIEGKARYLARPDAGVGTLISVRKSLCSFEEHE